MRFDGIRRYLEKNKPSIYSNDNNLKSPHEIKYALFKEKPFWIDDIVEHKQHDRANNGACCFNHIIGLPKKDGLVHKIYDYELQVINALENNSDVLINKARGLGITELILRYMAYLARLSLNNQDKV